MKRKENIKRVSNKLSGNDEHVNNQKLWVGPSFSGRTYLILIILSRIHDSNIYIITKSPPG